MAIYSAHDRCRPTTVGEHPRRPNWLRAMLHTLLLLNVAFLLGGAPTVSRAFESGESEAPAEEQESSQETEAAIQTLRCETRRSGCGKTVLLPPDRNGDRQGGSTCPRRFTLGHRLANGLLAPLRC